MTNATKITKTVAAYIICLHTGDWTTGRAHCRMTSTLFAKAEKAGWVKAVDGRTYATDAGVAAAKAFTA